MMNSEGGIDYVDESKVQLFSSKKIRNRQKTWKSFPEKKRRKQKNGLRE